MTGPLASLPLKDKLAAWSTEVSDALNNYIPFNETGEASFAVFASAGEKYSYLLTPFPVAETMWGTVWDEDGLKMRIKDLVRSMEVFMR